MIPIRVSVNESAFGKNFPQMEAKVAQEEKVSKRVKRGKCRNIGCPGCREKFWFLMELNAISGGRKHSSNHPHLVTYAQSSSMVMEKDL